MAGHIPCMRAVRVQARNMTSFREGDELEAGFRFVDGEVLTTVMMADMVAGGFWEWVVRPEPPAAAEDAPLTRAERQRRLDGDDRLPQSAAPTEALRAEEEAVMEEVRADAAGDDLTLIRGLGVKAAATLRRAGVRTFEQLARMEEEALEEILAAVPGLRRSLAPGFQRGARLQLEAAMLAERDG